MCRIESKPFHRLSTFSTFSTFSTKFWSSPQPNSTSLTSDDVSRESRVLWGATCGFGSVDWNITICHPLLSASRYNMWLNKVVELNPALNRVQTHFSRERAWLLMRFETERVSTLPKARPFLGGAQPRVESVESRVNSQETSVSQCISAAKGAQPKSQRQRKTQGQHKLPIHAILSHEDFSKCQM